MFIRKWRSGASKAHPRRIWWRYSPTTRNPGFKPSRTAHPTFHPHRENMLRSGATTSTSDTEHSPSWRASTCCRARFWDWCVHGTAARNLSSFWEKKKKKKKTKREHNKNKQKKKQHQPTL